jgi:hypothetical protein
MNQLLPFPGLQTSFAGRKLILLKAGPNDADKEDPAIAACVCFFRKTDYGVLGSAMGGGGVRSRETGVYGPYEAG